MPLLEDPWVPEDADTVIMESTYGDRDHDDTGHGSLAEVALSTIRRGGKVIILSLPWNVPRKWYLR